MPEGSVLATPILPQDKTGTQQSGYRTGRANTGPVSFQRTFRRRSAP